ncbi:hypothetical protein Tco_0507430 [Tanacetum coccineum]
MAQRAFDAALCSALERIVTASGPGFGDWQWRLATLPFSFGGIGVYYVASGPTFNDALCAFNTKMETGLLSNASEIAAPKLMKKLADKYFTCVLLFSVSKSCSTCSKVFIGDIMETMLYPVSTRMVDFVPGRAVIDATHRKRVKYEAKCANIGYGFLPFSFSSLGELEKDAVNLLKRIRSFS